MVYKTKIKLGYFLPFRFKYVFSCNIKALHNHHEARFISLNLWIPRKLILIVGNGVNGEFISHCQNLATHLSLLSLTRDFKIK